VILHPCDWQSAPFGGLRATLTDGKPVSMFANQHEAFAIITKDIRDAAAKFAPQSPPPATRASSSTVQSAVIPGSRSSNLRVKRNFSDHEQDQFLEDSFEYIARYFEGSLAELSKRNPHLQTRFRRIDANSFTAAAYADGKRAAQCTIRLGNKQHAEGIIYSDQENAPRGSYNESLNITDDGYTLLFKPLLNFRSRGHDETLSQQGAAEFYWGRFIEPLQR
jgi:hypothetical protein